GQDPAPADAVRQRRAAFAADPSPAGLFAPPLLTGAALMQAGLKPGPSFGVLLERVRDAQREGQVSTPEAALELALELARAPD
ncbi:MAG: hypothetical protein KDD82_04850, partial [Planctomycetes bacterium]|nr:hypothetical protein [Planctomycetota bacterium]